MGFCFIGKMHEACQKLALCMLTLFSKENLPASRRGVRQIKGPVNVYFKTLDELQDICSTKVLPITFNADKAFNR